MPRLEFDTVKNGTNLRKHGISLDRFGDMDFDARWSPRTSPTAV
jgi:uncharacterized DUF497 family protein